jgi:biopolymer transport protein ExbD
MNNQTCDTPLSKELPTLRVKLKEITSFGGGKDPVIVRPAPDTRHERVMDVLNAAAAASVKNLTFN